MINISISFIMVFGGINVKFKFCLKQRFLIKQYL